MSMRGPGHSLALLVLIASGCSLGPRQFQDLNDQAPLVRARAAGLSDTLPRTEFIPELIDHLGDPDAVVRLSSHEELRRRTGQDFGYRPWDDESEREAAVGRWRVWWENQLRAVSSPEGLERVPTPAGTTTMGGPSS